MRYLNAEVLFLLVFVTDYIRTELNPDGKNVCLSTENYKETVMVQVKKKKTVRKWCWRVRCSKQQEFYKDEPRVYHRTRIVAKCCDGYREEIGQTDCVPTCLKGCKNGKCIAPDTCACNPGFHGPECDKECPEGWWGLNCINKCTCSDNGICNKKKGCECKSGWMGDRCDLPCREGYYGYSCEKKCKCDLVCNHETGECTKNALTSTPGAANYDAGTSNSYQKSEKDQVSVFKGTERNQVSLHEGTEGNQISVSEVTERNQVSLHEGTERNQVSVYEGTERNQVSVYEGTERNQVSVYEGTERNQVSVSEVTERNQVSLHEGTEGNQISVSEVTERNQVSLHEGTEKNQVSVSEVTERNEVSVYEETEGNQISVSEGTQRNQVSVTEIPGGLETKIFTEDLDTTWSRSGEDIKIEYEINSEIATFKQTELPHSVASTTEVTKSIKGAISADPNPKAVTESFVTYFTTSKTSGEETTQKDADIKFKMQNEINFLEGLEPFSRNASIKGTEATEYATEVTKGDTLDTTIINDKTFWITSTNAQQPDRDETDNLISSEKGSAPNDYLNTKFHFFASLSILSGISLVIFVIAARWIIVSHKRRVQKIILTAQKEKILHTEQGKGQPQNFFWVGDCAENPVYLSDVDINKAVPILQTFKPVN